MKPPLAPKKDHVVRWHGQEVRDPWYWLRDKTDPEVLAYLEAENDYLEASTPELKPFSQALFTEMLARLKQTDLSLPRRRDAHYYYARIEEGQQYSSPCRRAASPDGSWDAAAPEELLLDSNALAEGQAYFDLGHFNVSDDGNHLLFSTDTVGFRQYRLQVKDLRTGEVSEPIAERVTSIAWLASDRHIVFTTEDEVTKRSDKLWRHDLGTGERALMFEETDELYSLSIGRTRDRAYIVATAHSTDTRTCALLSCADPSASLRTLLPREKGHKYLVDHREGSLYIVTNRDAKNFRLVRAPIDEPTQWTELIPHRADTLLESVDTFAHHIVVKEKREGLVRFRICELASETWREVAFPEQVYDAELTATADWNARAFHFGYQSLVTPPMVCAASFADATITVLKQTEVQGGYDPQLYATERRWVTARDGARVPVSMVYKKSTPLDGSAPCLLCGYGAYGIGSSPEFSSTLLSILDRGVVYAIAHVRGGDELGEAWHDDGMLMKKKNTFFDFIDVAEWLVEARITSRDRLLAEGESAGGLLIGAVVNMRPDLWRAVHADVPFVDVLNTMFDDSLPLTIGEHLEWGDPDDQAVFEYMRSYCPYENVAAKAYPAMLVTTGLNDSQVMYWEPAKWVAKLRHTKTDRNPLHLKCNMGAGHGGASGLYDQLRDISFEWAWLLTQVGITR